MFRDAGAGSLHQTMPGTSSLPFISVGAERVGKSDGSHDLARHGPDLRSVRISVMIVCISSIVFATTNSQGRRRHSPRSSGRHLSLKSQTDRALRMLLSDDETCSVTPELVHYKTLGSFHLNLRQTENKDGYSSIKKVTLCG